MSDERGVPKRKWASEAYRCPLGKNHTLSIGLFLLQFQKLFLQALRLRAFFPFLKERREEKKPRVLLETAHSYAVRVIMASLPEIVYLVHVDMVGSLLLQHIWCAHEIIDDFSAKLLGALDDCTVRIM